MSPATKVALVSGGSRGIGRAVVCRLAADGFDVSFCYRSDEDAARQVAKVAEESGVRIRAYRCDVSDAEAVRSWVAGTEQDLGPIDAVVTSAGITRDKPLVMMKDEEWDEVLRTNLDGVYNVCRVAVFGMMKRRSGSVVTISSVTGVSGNIAQTNYAASKAGIIGFTKALAKEVGPRGIRANVVAPGLIETEMLATLGDKLTAKMLEQVPLGRLGRAEEVAELVAFLAGDKSSYVTRSVFEVHGGIAL